MFFSVVVARLLSLSAIGIAQHRTHPAFKGYLYSHILVQVQKLLSKYFLTYRRSDMRAQIIIKQDHVRLVRSFHH
jgi:hypothetical protein